MYCLKCGKDTVDQNVFCGDCLQSMEKYPVKPGTAVYIPTRTKPVQEKKKERFKRLVAQRDHLEDLRRIIKWMAILLTLTTIALGLVTTMLLFWGLPGL